MDNINDAQHGHWLKCDSSVLPLIGTMTDVVKDTLVRRLEDIEGPQAAKHVESFGLERIHEVLELKNVGLLRDGVLETLRFDLLKLAASVGRNILHWAEDFFVDDYLILRINYPYEIARKADPKAENPGIGRLSEQVRSLAHARRVIDPIYNPRAYHKDHPPAAWAHGPHLDSWAGHSKGGRNLWWAISPVPPDAGMVLYPELSHLSPPVDPTSLYLQKGFRLPRPTYFPLNSGEMLVFDPEVLHGTHLNTSDGTRVAVSMRLNAAKPVFDPGCFYAREFWRRAGDIEAGVDEILHLKREDNLGEGYKSDPAVWAEQRPGIVGMEEDGVVKATLPGHFDAELFTVKTNCRSLLVKKSGKQIDVFDNQCPHYGVELSDGGSQDNHIYCPACALKFDLRNGSSSSDLFRLKKYPAELLGETLIINTNK